MNWNSNYCVKTILLLFITLLSSCSKNDDNANEHGSANFYLTDAAVDNANVQGVFVTIAEIKINGNALPGFSKQTINLMDYQNGNTKLLTSGDLNTGSYNKVELVLDEQNDQDGNAPGCYVLTNNGKVNLTSVAGSTFSILAPGNFNVSTNQSADMVIDFDLRKALVQSGSGSDGFSFVAQNGLNSAVRVVQKDMTGKIEGTYSGTIGSDEEVVAYAYKTGTFNMNTETTPDSDGLLFANAVNSDKVEGPINGSYSLSFMNEGDYELHFAQFRKNSDGSFSFDSMLDISSSGDIAINDIKVTAGADISLSVILNGVLN